MLNVIISCNDIIYDNSQQYLDEKLLYCAHIMIKYFKITCLKVHFQISNCAYVGYLFFPLETMQLERYRDRICICCIIVTLIEFSFLMNSLCI